MKEGEKPDEYLYIIKNGLGPGDNLPAENEIGKKLGISKSSVREAIKSLQALGIISTKQKRGIVLKNLTPGALGDYLTFGLHFNDPTILDLMEARMAVEIGVLPIVVSNAETDDFEVRENAILVMESAGEDIEAWVKADETFHQSLIKALKNKALSVFSDVVSEFFKITRQNIKVADIDCQRISREHKEILVALENGDVACTAKVLQQHLLPHKQFSPSKKKNCGNLGNNGFH